MQPNKNRADLWMDLLLVAFLIGFNVATRLLPHVPGVLPPRCARAGHSRDDSTSPLSKKFHASRSPPSAAAVRTSSAILRGSGSDSIRARRSEAGITDSARVF